MSALRLADRVWSSRPRWIKQFLRYAVVGIVNVALYYVLFNVLLTLDWSPLAANAVSFFPVTVNSFLLNKIWSFEDRQLKGVTRQYAVFLLWTLVALAVETGCLWLLLIPLEPHGRLGVNIAATLTAPFTAVTNFLAQRRWTFAQTNGLRADRERSAQLPNDARSSRTP